MKKLFLTCLGFTLVLSVTSASALGLSGTQPQWDYYKCPTWSNTLTIGDIQIVGGIQWVFESNDTPRVPTGTTFTLGPDDQPYQDKFQYNHNSLHCNGTFTHKGNTYKIIVRGNHNYKRCEWNNSMRQFQCTNY